MRPRWVDIASILVGLAVLNVLGQYYHQWVLAIPAAIAAAVSVVVLYHVASRPRVRKRVQPCDSQHAVMVRLTTPTGAATSDDLSMLETELTEIIDAQEVGEYDAMRLERRVRPCSCMESMPNACSRQSSPRFAPRDCAGAPVW